jgi:hypothetical protein
MFPVSNCANKAVPARSMYVARRSVNVAKRVLFIRQTPDGFECSAT